MSLYRKKWRLDLRYLQRIDRLGDRLPAAMAFDLSHG
jgi:hypothetical protein